MSFPVMIHLKSTLAISAIMLTGLVAASPFPYSSDRDTVKPRSTVSIQPVAAAEAAPMPAATVVWTDPPVKAAPPVEQPATLASAPAAIEPATIAPAPVRRIANQAKAEQPRHRKVARAATRQRQVAMRQTGSQKARTAETQVAAGTATATSSRIDPIGDILRGLGFGKQG
ncbi:hypothetical protein [Methylobacterium gnaphalii]|nr:hypothetical protein [Methylobacterium gnaphalii]